MRALVISGNHDQAIASLEAYAAEHPRGKHASRAGLFLFKANFAKRDYAEARKWCDWTIQNHPNSLEARKCEFKLGLVLMAQQDLGGALKQFEAVVSSNRNPLRPEATFFVDELKAQIAAGKPGATSRGQATVSALFGFYGADDERNDLHGCKQPSPTGESACGPSKRNG